MSDNYPPGAANDPRAPYNQEDPEMTEFEEVRVGTCDICDDQRVPLDSDSCCEECFVAQEVQLSDDDDGDRDYDSWKDSQLE